MPGGLLDLFGIDPIANRNRKDAKDAIEIQARTELEKQRLANQGQIDVTKTMGVNATEKAKLDAIIAHAKELGISPDMMDVLKKERQRLDTTKMEGNQNRAETDVERSRQEQSDAAAGSRARGMQPKYQPKALPYGIGGMSGDALKGMLGATNSPLLGALAQAKAATAPAQLEADPNMLRNVLNSEMARAAIPSIQARSASAITTPKGSATSMWSPGGTANQFGAIENNTLIPSKIPGLPPTVSQAETFPESFSPEDMAAAAQLPPPSMQQLPVTPSAPTPQMSTMPINVNTLPQALPMSMPPLLPPAPEPNRGSARSQMQWQREQELKRQQEASLQYLRSLISQ